MNSVESCPFCHLTLPLSELQRHANNHFEEENHGDHVDDEQLARDLELAEKISLTPFSTSEESLDEKLTCLMGMQTRASFYYIKDGGDGGGLMALLCKCLELEADGTTTNLLAGCVDHFQSMPSEDVGWGCGWRNIQILSSYLISHRQDAREVLFGGSGFVPDIPSLQRWLEIAWERGFDAAGSHHFNHSVYGSKCRIGATECAALFRSFGLRARIVDFGPKELGALFLSVPGTSLGSQVLATNAGNKSKAFHVYGPMDRYLSRRNCNDPQPDSNAHDKSQCFANHLAGRSNHTTANKFSRKTDSHHVLLDWVWNYFSGESLTASSHNWQVIVTNKSPLYFQHDGHSRTIVGIQIRRQKKGMHEYNLLVLDPSHRTTVLERSLRENVGWKKLIKRGVHTLKKPQYQLCYIDPGIACGEEMEQLKTLDSVFVEF